MITLTLLTKEHEQYAKNLYTNFIDPVRKHPRNLPKRFICYIIKQNDKPVGIIGGFNEDGVGNVMTFIDEQYLNKGYGYTATKELIAIWKDQGINSFKAYISTEDNNARKILKKLNFTFDSIVEQGLEDLEKWIL